MSELKDSIGEVDEWLERLPLAREVVGLNPFIFLHTSNYFYSQVSLDSLEELN